MSTAETSLALRPDLAAIAAMIRPGARVLDVGCGDGALLEHLKTKNVDGRGIEISQANVNACVARGLAVVQGDADTDLVDYPAQVSFVEIKSDKGHDAFLLDEPEMFATVRGFLNHAAQDLA